MGNLMIDGIKKINVTFQTQNIASLRVAHHAVERLRDDLVTMALGCQRLGYLANQQATSRLEVTRISHL